MLPNVPGERKVVQLTSTGLWENGVRVPAAGAGIKDLERRAAELRQEGWQLVQAMTGTWIFERIEADGR